MRLQKFLSEAGFCSRRKGEKYIQAGRVMVNEKVVVEPGIRVNSETDTVQVDDRKIKLETQKIYIALHKPTGYVTSCKQKKDRIVLDLVDIPQRVYPVGRLDKDSSGLLIITNDGALHHRLSHPSFDHEKEYLVTVSKPIPAGALGKMAKGLPMMGTKTRSAKIKKISSNQFFITLKEGKNRQIRRMVRKVGGIVIKLERVRIANIKLGKLAEGKWRHLSEKEKEILLGK